MPQSLSHPGQTLHLAAVRAPSSKSMRGDAEQHDAFLIALQCQRMHCFKHAIPADISVTMMAMQMSSHTCVGHDALRSYPQLANHQYHELIMTFGRRNALHTDAMEAHHHHADSRTLGALGSR